MSVAFIAGDQVALVVTPAVGTGLLDFTTATSANLVVTGFDNANDTANKKTFVLTIAGDKKSASYTMQAGDFVKGGLYSLELDMVTSGGTRKIALSPITVGDPL